MNQTWPIISKIVGQPYRIDDGDLLCFALDVVLDDWGVKERKTLYFVSKSQAEAQKVGQECRRL